MHELLQRAADWWLGTAIGGGLVLLIGCGLMRLTRHPAARQRLGECAVLAALVVAGLRLLPAWLPVVWITDSNPPLSHGLAEEGAEVRTFGFQNPEPSPPNPFPQSLERREQIAAERVAETAAPPFWTWHDATAGLMAGYLLVAAGLAARWLLGQWALNRLLRQARPATPRVRRLFKAMAADTLSLLPRLRRRTHLRVARRLRAPVCFGLRRPAVLLPEPMDDAADAQLRWVFTHELTHLRRRDPWSSWGLGLAQAVYFFVPWFWWLKRSVRLCQEYVADAAAAESGAAPDEYAQFLVNLARGATPLGATGLGSSSDLLRRVQMLLQSSTRVQGSWPRRRSLLAAGGLLAVAVFAGGVCLRAEPPKERNDGQEFKLTILRYEDGKEKKEGEENKTAEKTPEKMTIRMKMVIDTGDGSITIPLDGAAADLGKEIEAAIKKAQEEAGAARKHSEAIKKALESLKGELTDEQIKRLEQQLKTMKAQAAKVDAQRIAVQRVRDAVVQQADAARQGKKAEAGGKPFVGTVTLSDPLLFAATPHMGSRLGARMLKPSADLADQLDLPKDQGLVITEVLKDSAAAKAGLKVNDILLEFAGKPVSSDAAAFARSLHEMKANDEVSAVIMRKGRKEKVTVKLPEAKAEGTLIFGGEGGNPPFRLQLQGGGTFELPARGRSSTLTIVAPELREAELELQKALEQVVPGKKPAGQKSVSVRIENGKFIAEQKEGEVNIGVTGKVNDDKVNVEQIQIDEGESKKTYKRIDYVPEKHRDAVKTLIAHSLEPLNRSHDDEPQEK